MWFVNVLGLFVLWAMAVHCQEQVVDIGLHQSEHRSLDTITEQEAKREKRGTGSKKNARVSRADDQTNPGAVNSEKRKPKVKKQQENRFLQQLADEVLKEYDVRKIKKNDTERGKREPRLHRRNKNRRKNNNRNKVRKPGQVHTTARFDISNPVNRNAFEGDGQNRKTYRPNSLDKKRTGYMSSDLRSSNNKKTFGIPAKNPKKGVKFIPVETARFRAEPDISKFLPQSEFGYPKDLNFSKRHKRPNIDPRKPVTNIETNGEVKWSRNTKINGGNFEKTIGTDLYPNPYY